jgi:hypothetical protein
METPVKSNLVHAIPDLRVALRPDFMQNAEAGA